MNMVLRSAECGVRTIADCGLPRLPRLPRLLRLARLPRLPRLRISIGVALVGALLAGGAVRAETIDRVLAVVSGQSGDSRQLITLSDVTAARDLGLQSAAGAPDPIRAILSKLIDRELMLAEVDRYAPPEPSTDAVDREVAVVKARFPSESAYAEALARSGIDEKHLRETLRQNLRMVAYLDRRFNTAQDRRQALVDEWVTGLRRRAEVVDLYLSGR